MIEYRTIGIEDVTAFWAFLNTLDAETNFMLYEPGERKLRRSPSMLEAEIRSNVIDRGDFFQLAVDEGRIVGYLCAQRGTCNRVRHSAYIVVGILQSHRGKGIGTALFQHLNQWAQQNQIVRLELTVECANQAAVQLYQKSGFVIEGTRKRSMYVDGQYVDEYYMAKVL